MVGGEGGGYYLCGPKGYGFSAVFVKFSLFWPFGHKLAMVGNGTLALIWVCFKKPHFHHYRNED